MRTYAGARFRRRRAYVQYASPLRGLRGGEEVHLTNDGRVPEVPPPGPPLPFAEWTHVLVERLRELLPDIAAARGGGVVVIRRPKSVRVVTITQERGAYWIATTDSAGPMARLVDADRHDAHTARTFAHSIAGGFDARLSR